MNTGFTVINFMKNFIQVTNAIKGGTNLNLANEFNFYPTQYFPHLESDIGLDVPRSDYYGV